MSESGTYRLGRGAEAISVGSYGRSRPASPNWGGRCFQLILRIGNIVDPVAYFSFH